MAAEIRRHIEQYQDMIARLFPPTQEMIDGAGDRRILSRVLTFQVTDACNLGCDYCYQINKGRRKMSFETAKKMIDMALEKPEKLNNYLNPEISPAIILEFIGGEPFLEIELMDKIVDYFVARTIELEHPWATRFCISICSNGALYFHEKVQNFLRKHRHRISFSVTIDGNRELHDSCRVFLGTRYGSYDVAVAAANDWMSRGYYMGSKITIAPGNLEHLYSAITHMVDLGYDEINANVVYEEGWNLEYAKAYYKELKRIADYWIDNNLVESHYLALFEENFFHPKEPEDNDNWCFKAGTKITMANGSKKNIEDIQIGDMVHTGFGNNYKPVTDLLSHEAEDTWKLEIEDCGIIYTTEDHPFYTPMSFRKAKGLRPGDVVCVLNKDNYTFTFKRVLKSEPAGEKYTVYNLTVEHFHSFVANDIIVHNCGGNGEMLSVDPDGFLYPCIRYMESSLGTDRDPYRIGDVDNGIGFTDEYQQKIKCLHCITRRSQSTDECFYCPIAEGCSWCFPAGTKILTKDGYKNIEEIQIGDYVYDKDNNLQLVSNNMTREVNEKDLIYVETSTLKNLLTTIEHPFYTKRNGVIQWIAAGELTDTDEIGLLISNKIIWEKVVTKRQELPKSIVVYNLTVDNTHNYIAEGAIVHNCTAYNYQECGTPDARATHICCMHKARSLANVYFWNKYYMSKNSNKVFEMHCPKDWALEIIDEDEYNFLLSLTNRE